MGRISSLLLLLLVGLLELLLEAPLEGGRVSPAGPAKEEAESGNPVQLQGQRPYLHLLGWGVEWISK